MKGFVAVEGRDLKRGLGVVIHSIQKRTHIPILSCVLLRFDGTRLELRGTDLEQEIITSVDVTDGSPTPWDMCVDGHVLLSIAKAAGPMNMHIEAAGEKVIIVLGDHEARYELSGIRGDDFPTLGKKRGKLVEEFSNGQFVAMLERARPYISSEETRYYLNGVCWEHGPNGRRVAATDGHRLYCCRYAGDAIEPFSHIIPRRTVDTLIHIGQGSDWKIFKLEGGTNITALWFDLGDAVVISKLIDGTFPQFDRVIPKPDDQRHRIKFASADVVAAINRACAVGSDGRGNNSAVKFHSRSGKVAIERTRANNDKATALTQSQWPEAAGKLEPFGFNGLYLSEILAGCEGEIELRIIDEKAPFQIADADETTTRVLMPMRV